MVNLITLAHRVSTIHAGYADIHAAVFPSSLAWLIHRSTHLAARHCKHEELLRELTEEMSRVYDIVRAENEMKFSSTINHDFIETMAKYILALTDTINKLADICRRLCRDSKGIEPYGESESREARITYDQSIQQYQRYGQQLSRMYEKF